MIREDFEFRIAAYADGTLSPAQRQAVATAVAADGEARALLADYQAIHRTIDRAARQALPAVHWDRLALHLSAMVAAVAARAAAPSRDGEAAPGETPSPHSMPPAMSLDEQTEFTLACYADGTLDPSRHGEVEQLVATDDRARDLLEAYQDLDATVKAVAYGTPGPHVDADQLAGRLSETVHGASDAALPEALERQIAAYAEGGLAAGEQDEVEARLASEPAARIALSEYRNLDAALKSLPESAPLPSVDWDRLAGGISAAVAGAEPDAVPAGAGEAGVLRLPREPEAPRDSAASPKRLGAGGPFSILSFFRSPMRLAAAASVLLAVALGARLLHRGPGTTNPGGPGVTPDAPLVAVVPLRPEAPVGEAVADIRIGPPKSSRDGLDSYAEAAADDDGVVSSPPRAFVASGSSVSDAADALPAMPF